MKTMGRNKIRIFYGILICCTVAIAILWVYPSYGRRFESNDLIPSQCSGTKIEVASLPNQYLFVSDNGLGLLHLINSEKPLIEEDDGTFSEEWIYRITFGSEYHIGGTEVPSDFSNNATTYEVLIGQSSFSIAGKLYHFTDGDRYKAFLETIQFKYNKYSEDYPIIIKSGQ